MSVACRKCNGRGCDSCGNSGYRDAPTTPQDEADLLTVTLFRCDVCGFLTNQESRSASFDRRVHKWGPPEQFVPRSLFDAADNAALERGMERDQQEAYCADVKAQRDALAGMLRAAGVSQQLIDGVIDEVTA